MSHPGPAYECNRELNMEFFVLRVLGFCISAYLLMQIAGMLRLLGVPGIPPILLVSYRILDLVFICSFFLACGPRLKVRWIDLPPFLMIFYPVLIGFSRGQINITFFNDIAIFLFFFLKVLVVRTLIFRIKKKTDFDGVFRIYAQKIVRQSILVAILLLGIAFAALAAEWSFYYQAPAELTFSAALAVAQKHPSTYLMILVLAVLAGKRGVVFGVLAIGAMGVFNRKKSISRMLASSLMLAAVTIAAAILVSGDGSLADAAVVRRWTGTWYAITTAFFYGGNLEQFLMFLDPGRFVEYVSLKPYLEGWALLFGNGFGFRYELDSNFLGEMGQTAIEGSVGNAHFTPLAIVAKFGIFGLALWIIQICGVLLSPRDTSSYFQVACTLGFVSMLFQSMFAFGFFVSFFTPIFIAGMTLARSGRFPARMDITRNTRLSESI